MIYRIGVIGLFNLTFELAWKALQEILKMHGEDGAETGSPRKNLQLGYSLPKSVVEKVGISNCRVFVSGENLLTFTSLSSIFDPETCVGGRGGNAYPLSSTWSIGLSETI